MIPLNTRFITRLLCFSQQLPMIMVDKEDLGLSLGLNFPAAAEDHRTSHSPSLRLNLMPFFGSSPSPFNFLRKTPDWTHTSSDRSKADGFGVETRSFLKGIDVNRTPATGGEEEEEAGVSSPNSGASSVSGKSSERGLDSDDRDGGERASSRGTNSDEEDGDNCRKKLRLSKEQSAVLEESFKGHHTLNPKQKLALAKRLGLRPRQVEVWFQNRRARTKLKQTEVDHELMKRCCENLREENKRLQKELQELRALKLSPQGYMQMAPPTTLTMCPSCAPSPKGLSGNRHHLTGMNQNRHRTLPFTLWANGDVGVHPLS